MKARWTLPLIAILVAAPGVAQDAAQGTDVGIEDEYDELLDEYDEAFAEYRAERLALAEASPEGGEAIHWPTPPAKFFYSQFDALARRGSGQAGVWCLTNFFHSGVPLVRWKEAKLPRYRELIETSADEPWIVDLLVPLGAEAYPSGSLGRETAFDLLDELRERSSLDEVLAGASYAKAKVLDRRGASDADRAEAAGLYGEVAGRWPDLEVGKRCAGFLFAAERLQVGMVAPDFESKDVDGNPIRLSDYRGKAVVLDFWGFW